MPDLVPIDNNIHAVACPLPFAMERVEEWFEPGTSLQDIVDKLCGSCLGTRITVSVNGEYIQTQEWATFYPEVGALIAVKVVPSGAIGRVIGAIFIAIAAIAAAVFTAGALTPLIGASWGLVVGGLAGLATSFVGNLALNALIPPTKPKLDQLSGSGGETSPALSVTGTANSINLYGAIPRVLGKYKVMPCYGAQPFTTVDANNNQNLTALFVWGYGPLYIDTAYIGETAFSSFPGSTMDTLYGWPGEDPLTIWNQNVWQENLSIELKPMQYNYRTSSPDTWHLEFDIDHPTGCYSWDSKGTYYPITQNFDVLIRETGSGNPYAITFQWTWVICDKSPQKRTIGFSPPTIGQWDICIMRTTPDYGNAVTYCVWSGFRSYRSTLSITTDPDFPLAISKVFLQASNSLSGQLRDLNAVVTSRLWDWDSGSSTWIHQPTQNPAAMFREVLQGTANARPVADARLDLPSIQHWHEFCTAKGFKYNKVIDYKTNVSDLIQEICAAGRAVPALIDGKWGVVVDEARTTPIQHFTPRNSWGFSSTKNIVERPHGLIVRFPNEDKGYVQDQRIVYDDGYYSGNATKFESLELPGVTDRDQVYRLARYHIACAKLRPEIYTFNADIEHIVCTKGDLIRVTHDVPLWGSGYARIKHIIAEAWPFAQNTTYVKATSTHVSGDYSPWYATDYSKSVISWGTEGAWVSSFGSTTNQRFHIDLGSGRVINRINLQNYHHAGADQNIGVKNFTVWGSNNAAAFAELTYNIDTNWTQLTTDITQWQDHVIRDIEDVQYAVVDNDQSYRYYALKFADNWGDADYMGIRRVELQEVDPAAGNINRLEIDNLFTMEALHSYNIRIRKQDGTSVVIDITLKVGNSNEVQLGTTYAYNVFHIQDLVMFGETDSESQELIITAIEPQDEMAAKITAVDYNADIYLADTETIPDWESNITYPITPSIAVAPIVVGIASSLDTTIFGIYGGQPRIFVTFQTDTQIYNYDIVGIQCRYRRAQTDNIWNYLPSVPLENSTVSIMPVELGVSYEFQLRYVLRDVSYNSPWSSIYTHKVSAYILSDIENLVTFYRDNRLVLKWDAIVSQNYPGLMYEVRLGTVWGTAQVIGMVKDPEFVTQGDGTYWVAAFLNAFYSPNPSSVVITGSNLTTNVLVTKDEYALGWPGTLTSLRIDDLGYLELSGIGLVDAMVDVDAVTDWDSYGGMATQGYYEIPTAAIVDVGQAQTCNLFASYTMTARDLYALIDNVPDFDLIPDFDGDFKDLVTVSLQIATAGNDAVFGSWQTFFPGQYSARKFKFRLALASNDTSVSPMIEAFSWTVDMPDRIESGTVDLDAAGEDITYSRPFQVVPDPVITVYNATAGDEVFLTSKTVSGFHCQVKNGGSGAARTIHHMEKAY